MSKFKVSAHLVPGERSPPGLFFLFLICPHMAFSLVHVDGEKDKERKVTVESWGKERSHNVDVSLEQKLGCR